MSGSGWTFLSPRRRRGTCRTETQERGTESRGDRCQANRPAYIPDLNTERKLELVTDALLKRGYKSAAVEKILGGNFERVLADIWSYNY